MLLEQEEQVEATRLRAKNGVIQLPEGGAIQTFPLPPSDFNPLQASDGELLKHGFPGRPAEAELLDSWQRTLRCRRIEPIFRRLEAPLPDRPAEITVSSSRESGITTPPGGNVMKDVQASWVVPNVYPPYGAVDGTWYSASSWIGFTGLSGLQFKVGVQSRVVSTFGSVARQFFPFWEWETYGLFQAVSLAVSPGDQVACYVVLDSAGTSATVHLNNLTAAAGISFKVSPGKDSLPNTQCDWVVEALKINSPDVALARFGVVYFESATSHNSLGTEFKAGTGDVIDMYASGKQIAHAGIANPYLVWTRFGPSPF